MKRLERFLIRNWYLFVIGCVLQRLAIAKAFKEREYQAVGGEWFVLSFVVLVALFARNIGDYIRHLLDDEEEDNEPVRRNSCKCKR